MALRNIRTDGDPILRKISRPVEELSDRMKVLIDDMFETMYEAGGVGLAAPQIGVLRRIFVADCGEEKKEPIAFINPEILESAGGALASEGCLSVPGYVGDVERAETVRVKYLDSNFSERELSASGLLARCIQHELDHLDGILYTDKVSGELRPTDSEAEETRD